MKEDDDLITLSLSCPTSFIELPLTALASLLRVHQIEPGNMADLATETQRIASEINAEADCLEIEYLVNRSDICIKLHGPNGVIQLRESRI